MVKVTVKTVSNKKSFQVEVDDGAMVSAVKSKIAETRSLEPTTQRLFCSGKELVDDKPLAEYYKEGGFLVLMVSKGKPRAPPPTSQAPITTTTTTTPQTTSVPATGPTAATAAIAGTGSEPSGAGAHPPPAGTGGRGETAGVGAGAGGSENVDPSAVAQMTAMGFPEDQVRMALVAALGNVNVATDFLMEGIPQHIDHFQTMETTGTGGSVGIQGSPSPGALSSNLESAAALGGAAGAAPGSSSSGQSNVLNFMRFHPQFNQIRQLVQENPAMLPNVLQQLGEQSEDLIALINQHPDDFVRLMNTLPEEDWAVSMGEGAEGGDEGDTPLGAFDMEGSSEMDGESVEGERSASGVTVELTSEEAEAVENLIAMVPGASRDDVLEAYMACDKNVEMAANLLFEGTM